MLRIFSRRKESEPEPRTPEHHTPLTFLQEHPRLLALLALSFFFGFGFLAVLAYFIYVLLKRIRSGI
jgi:hypothetical protein